MTQRVQGSPRPIRMLTRRDVLRSMGLLGAVVAAPPLIVGCGSGPRPVAQTAGISNAGLSRFLGGASARPQAISSIQEFTFDLYRRLVSKASGNLVCSPYSVAVALAMARNGAEGQTAAEMSQVLHADDVNQLNEGLDSLMLLIESRAGEYRVNGGRKATVSLDVANSLWGQRGERWQQHFLEALSRYYATGMREVDYKQDAEGARLAINLWTSRQTHGKIPELVPRSALDDQTRLVLVNAIYLKAPWRSPFDARLTRRAPFTLDSGRRVSVPMMASDMSVSLTEGPGWRAARLSYASSALAMTVVVPTSSLADLERSLDADAFTRMVATQYSTFVVLSLPRWKVRLNAGLRDPLSELGMPTAFDNRRADFSGMTRQDKLWISDVQHDAFVSVDEHGTEAAAATAVEIMGGSATAPPRFTVDRPFLFVIHDVATATPLFIGRVTDPSVVQA